MNTVPRPSTAPITRDFDAFVGRAAELASLAARLCSGSPGMLWIHGPVGVGKTMLVHRFARLARMRDVDAEVVDAHGSSLDAFVRALHRARDQAGPRGVVIADRIGALRHHEPELLRALVSASTRGPFAVVDRAPPPEAVRSLHLATLAVGDLSRDAALGYLQVRGVPHAKRNGVVAFAGGRPLALALAADALLEGADAPFALERTGHVARAIRERFLEGVGDPRHRRALDVCALLRATTEEAIAALVPGGDPHLTFQWLRGSGLVETRPEGLVPDPLARDALLEGLRQQAPAELRGLVERAWTCFVEIAHRARTEERRADALAQLAFVARADPRLLALADRACAAGTLAEARPGDLPALLDVARRWKLEAGPVAPVALDRGAFEDAVRAALRAYFDDARLARNPLLSTAMVLTRSCACADRIATLRLLLRETVDALRGSEDGDAQHRLLTSIYLTPSTGAEAGARATWMPYVTLRGHLALGVERVAELLWTLDSGDAEVGASA